MARNSLDSVSVTRDEPMKAQGSAQYFNRVSSDYFKRYTEYSPGGYAFRVRKQRLFELLEGEGRQVLDVGCGPGVLVPDMLSRGFEFWGVDAAPNMIEECYKSFGDVVQAHFSLGNAVEIEFPPESFDVVICSGVIDHIRDYERAISEMLRVVRKDGTLLVAFPNLFSPWAWWRNFVFYPALRVVRPLYFGLLNRPQPPALSSLATMHSQRGVSKLIERNGGEVCKVAYYNFNLLLSPLDELFPRTAVRLTERMEQLSTGWLRWLGCGFLVKVKKRS
jgi:ubiquinone/menaquinone biosynthesis C-methylase UbiE